METLDKLSAAELTTAFRTRALSPVEFTKICLARIEKLNPTLNAFCLVDAEGALAAAGRSEERWLRNAALSGVDGVPTTIKDLVSTAGYPFRRGSRAVSATTEGVVDAPAVARLREGGAVLLGKTTTPEFGHKAVTSSALCGITRNPWNPELTPGGSSGGSAVAAATGMGILHLGTDAGGSIRIPAGFTGVFGHKPTSYRVPMYPPSTFGHLAVQGPITKSVADSRLMMNLITRPDARDWVSPPVTMNGSRFGRKVKELRVAFAPTMNEVEVDPEVERLVGNAVQRLEQLGARVDMVQLELSDAPELFETIWSATALAIIAGFSQAQLDLFEPSFMAIAERGRSVDGSALVRAQNGCATLAERLTTLFKTSDVLVLPSLPVAAFPAGQDHPGAPKPYGWPEWTPFCYPFNLTRSPACSLPCGLTRDGRPVGLQIVAPIYQDELVLDVAGILEPHLSMPPLPTLT